jgi:hypothetical protein
MPGPFFVGASLFTPLLFFLVCSARNNLEPNLAPLLRVHLPAGLTHLSPAGRGLFAQQIG